MDIDTILEKSSHKIEYSEKNGNGLLNGFSTATFKKFFLIMIIIIFL